MIGFGICFKILFCNVISSDSLIVHRCICYWCIKYKPPKLKIKIGVWTKGRIILNEREKKSMV
ncbi:hypothetical protein V6Z11_A07G255800 [Gossypium hirsutum]